MKSKFVLLFIALIEGCTSFPPLNQEDLQLIFEQLRQVKQLEYEHSIDDFNILNPSSSAASDYGKHLR